MRSLSSTSPAADRASQFRRQTRSAEATSKTMRTPDGFEAEDDAARAPSAHERMQMRQAPALSPRIVQASIIATLVVFAVAEAGQWPMRTALTLLLLFAHAAWLLSRLAPRTAAHLALLPALVFVLTSSVELTPLLRTVVDISGTLTVAIALGAVLPGAHLPALHAALMAQLVVRIFHDAGSAEVALVAGGAALVVFALPRVLYLGVMRAARHREQTRVDADLLRLYHDARLLRLLGASTDDEHKLMLAHTLTANEACFRAVAFGLDALGCDGAALYVVRDVQLLLHEQRLRHDDNFKPHLALNQGIANLCIKQRRAVRLLDAHVCGMHRAGAQAALAVPVVDNGAVHAVVLFDRDRADAFDATAERLACHVTEAIRHALATERALIAVNTERRYAARLAHVGKTLCGVVDEQEVLRHLDTVAREIVTDAETALFARDATSPHQLRCTHSSTGLQQHVGGLVPIDAESWVGRALLQNAALPHATVDIATRGLVRHDDGATRDVTDLRAMPLCAQSEVFAVFVVARRRGRISDEERDALTTLADIGALALSGAQLYMQMQLKATTDGLTGLVNRRTLDERLDQALARVRRTESPLSLMLVDIDHFKSVNDTYGHATGDAVLQGVSRALKDNARDTDIVARYGGEEMCVVLEATDLHGARVVAERMRAAIQALHFESDKGPLGVTASFGVSQFRANDTALTLRERADTGLYEAKRSGRNRVIARGQQAQ